MGEMESHIWKQGFNWRAQEPNGPIWLEGFSYGSCEGEARAPGVETLHREFKLLGQGCQTHFHQGPRQPCGCLQRAECNFRTV